MSVAGSPRKGNQPTVSQIAVPPRSALAPLPATLRRVYPRADKEANNDAGLAAHPSNRWMINANWFQIVLLAYNLNFWLP
jgi:hypothetical protein